MQYEVEAPMTLLEGLRKLYPDSSNTTLRDLVKQQSVYLDEQLCVKHSQMIEKGQQISIKNRVREADQGIRILYEDRYLIVIDKPEGLLSVPLDEDRGIRSNALDLLNSFFHTTHIYAVHRLDKEVSGVMVFARGRRSATLLSALFKEHQLTRNYCAIVEGSVKEDKGRWESLLIEAKSYKVYTTTNEEEGVRAVTHFEVVRRTKQFTFLHLTLETGKKHQIRVQCKEAGHPIAGDKIYGNRSCNPISRICLHSAKLEFTHPFTNKTMTFEASLPSAFSKLVNFSF